MSLGDVQVIKNTLNEIATHAYTLAMGLQNAAPAFSQQDEGKPLKTVQYLLNIATLIQQVNTAIETWSKSYFASSLLAEQEERSQLVHFIAELLREDQSLREKHQTAEKFRFVRDRLNLLLEKLKSSYVIKETTSKTGYVLASDEAIVYVHLYNAYGSELSTWQNLLNEKVFYEYSVNRPLYAEKSQVEALIRTKANRAQHGCLGVVVKKSDILTTPIEQKDNIGNPLIKVKEGSLLKKNVISFIHNEQEYFLGEKGELVKKFI